MSNRAHYVFYTPSICPFNKCVSVCLCVNTLDSHLNLPVVIFNKCLSVCQACHKCYSVSQCKFEQSIVRRPKHKWRLQSAKEMTLSMQPAYNMISEPCQLEPKMPRAATPPPLLRLLCVLPNLFITPHVICRNFLPPRVPGPATVSYQAPPGLKPERSDKEILRTAQLQIQCHFQHKSTTTISQFMLCTGSLLQKYTK